MYISCISSIDILYIQKIKHCISLWKAVAILANTYKSPVIGLTTISSGEILDEFL